MEITNAKYGVDPAGNNIGVMADFDGKTIFAPNDPTNRHYAEILRQAAAGELTIADAG